MPPKNGLAAKLLLEARKGYPLAVTARLARIRPADLAAWVEEGDLPDADPEAQRFTRDYYEQWYGFITEQHDTVAEAALSGKDAPNCMARLALLERIAPELYAKRAAPETTPEAPSDVPKKVAALDPEDRAAIKDALDRRKGARQVADTSGPTLKRL